jgi:hypothetical protein
MNRSNGVTANAILVIVGSALVLAVGLLALLGIVVGLRSAPVDTPPGSPLPPAAFKAFFLLAPLVYILPAIWGICSGVGLLQLKNWARISVIVFAAFLVVTGLCAGLVSLALIVMPPPRSSELDLRALTIGRIFMAISAVVEVSIGVWWLVFFNVAKTRAQFQRPVLPWTAVAPTGLPTPPPPGPANQTASPLTPIQPASRRPLSITIIACYLLLGAAFFPINLAMHAPAALFTKLLIGWAAVVYWLVLGAVQVYLGVGLLRLRPASRLVAMAYLVFALLNSVVFFFAPGGRDRLLQLIQMQHSLFPWMNASQSSYPLRIDPTPFIMIGAVFGAGVVVVILYFLFQSREAFTRPAVRASS